MSLTAVLLCGGESRRMGRDKATMPWRGRSLWEWQMEKLRDLQPERILLSARAEQRWWPAEVEIVLDESPSRGPLSGLVAALTRMETEHLIALAVDMPLMTTKHLRLLCNFADQRTGVVPMIGERFEPLAAVYPKALQWRFAEAVTNESDASLQRLVRRCVAEKSLRAFCVASSDAALYANLNNPTDWRMLDAAALQ